MRSNCTHSTPVIVLMMGCFGLTGCYSMNGYVMNASGQRLYEKGNYAAAAGEFQNALASNPANPDYVTNLAKTRYKMGDPAAAESLYRQALAMDPSHQPSYHGLAELMLSQGRGQEAGNLLTTWAATQPYVAESHLELAWLQRESGNPAAAAESLQRALQANPNHATALAHLGQYYHDSGQPGQAMAMYQRSLRANWNQPEVHSQLASAAEKAGASHPMSRTAMARGVHPHSIPRQQLAFAPQPQLGPAQFAQPQFAQPQVQPSQMAASQPAWNGQPQITMTAPQSMNPPGLPHQAFFPASPVTMPGFGMTEQVITTTGPSPNPNPTAPANATNSAVTPSMNIVQPTPDPAFATGVPTLSISQSSEAEVNGTESTEVIEVEAF